MAQQKIASFPFRFFFDFTQSRGPSPTPIPVRPAPLFIPIRSLSERLRNQQIVYEGRMGRAAFR